MVQSLYHRVSSSIDSSLLLVAPCTPSPRFRLNLFRLLAFLFALQWLSFLALFFAFHRDDTEFVVCLSNAFCAPTVLFALHRALVGDDHAMVVDAAFLLLSGTASFFYHTCDRLSFVSGDDVEVLQDFPFKYCVDESSYCLLNTTNPLPWFYAPNGTFVSNMIEGDCVHAYTWSLPAAKPLRS